MGSGNAILAGLLGGFGNAATGIGNAFAQQQKDELERERLAQERDLKQQVIDAQASQFATTQKGLSTPAEQLFGYIGMPLPQGMDPKQPIPNTLGDNLIKVAQEQQKVAREQDLQTKTAAFLRGAQGRPGQPAELMGQLADGEDPEAAALIPRSANVPAVAPMGRMGVAAGLTQFGHKDAGLKALMDSVFGAIKDPVQPNSTSQIMQAADELSRRLDAGETEENSARVRSLTAQLNVAKIVAGQPGGDIYGAGALIGRRSAPDGTTPPAPGTPAPSGPQPLVRTPGMPSPGERKDIADVDARIAAFTTLADQAESPEIQSMLGVKGMPARVGEDYLKMDNLTPAQREFRARSRIELTAASRIMIGVGQTNSELARLAPALPGENDPGFPSKLKAWAAWAQQNRDSINASLGGLNIRVPAQQGAPAPKPAPTSAPPATSAPRSSAGGGGMIVTDGTKRFMWTGTKDELATQYPGFREWTP